MAFLAPEIIEVGAEVLPEVLPEVLADMPETAKLISQVKSLVENVSGKGATFLQEATEHLNNLSNLLNSLNEFHQNTKATVSKFKTPESASAIVRKNMSKLKKTKSGTSVGAVMNGVMTELYKEIDKKAPVKRLVQFYDNVLKVFHKSNRLTSVKSVTEDNLGKVIGYIEKETTSIIDKAKNAGTVDSFATKFIEDFVTQFGFDFISASLTPVQKLSIICTYISTLSIFTVAPTFGAWSNAIDKFKILEIISTTLMSLKDSDYVDKIKDIQAKLLIKELIRVCATMIGEVASTMLASLQEGLTQKTKKTLQSMLDVKPFNVKITGEKLDTRKGLINLLIQLKDAAAMAAVVKEAANRMSMSPKKLSEYITKTNDGLKGLINSLDAKETRALMDNDELFTILKDMNAAIASDKNLRKRVTDKVASGKAIRFMDDNDIVVGDEYRTKTYKEVLLPRVLEFRRAVNAFISIFPNSVPELAKIGLSDSERDAFVNVLSQRPGYNVPDDEVRIISLLGYGISDTARDDLVMYKRWAENCKKYMGNIINNAKDLDKKHILQKYAGMIIAGADQILKIITDSRKVLQALQKSKSVSNTKMASGLDGENDLAFGGAIDGEDNTIGGFLGGLFGNLFTTDNKTENGDSLDQSTLDTDYRDIDSLSDAERGFIDDFVVEGLMDGASSADFEDALTLRFGFGSAVRKIKQNPAKVARRGNRNVKLNAKKPKTKMVISEFSKSYRKYLEDFKDEGLSGRSKAVLYDDASALTAINSIKTTYEMTKSVHTADQLSERDKQRAKEISTSVFENMVKQYKDVHKAYEDYIDQAAPNRKWVNDDAENARVKEGFETQKIKVLELLRDTMAVIQGIQASNQVISNAKLKIDTSSLPALIELGKYISGLVSTDQLYTARKKFNNEVAIFFQIMGGSYDLGPGTPEIPANLLDFDAFFNSADPVFGDPGRSIRLPFRALDTKHHNKLLRCLAQMGGSAFMFDDLIKKINAIYSVVGTDLFKSQGKFDSAGFLNIANALIEHCSTMPIIENNRRFFTQRGDRTIVRIQDQLERVCSGFSSPNGTWILVTNDYTPEQGEALAYRDELINIQRIVLRSILAASMQPLGILLKHLETSVPIIKMYGAFASGGSVEDEVYSQLARFDKINVENVYLYAIAAYFVKFYSNVLIDYNNGAQDAYSFAHRNYDLPMVNIIAMVRTSIDAGAAAVDPSFKGRPVLGVLPQAFIDQIIMNVNKWVSKNKLLVTDSNREVISKAFADDLRTAARYHLTLVDDLNIDKYREYLNKTITAAELVDFSGDFRLNIINPTYDYSELPESVMQSTKSPEKKIVATFDPTSMTKIGNLIDSFVRAIPKKLVRGLDEKIRAAYEQIKMATTDMARRNYLEQFINGTIKTVNSRQSENYSMMIDIIKVYIEQTLGLSVIVQSFIDEFVTANNRIFASLFPINAGADYLIQIGAVPVANTPPNTNLANQFRRVFNSKKLFGPARFRRIYNPTVNSCNRFLTPMIITSELNTTSTGVQFNLPDIIKTGITLTDNVTSTSIMSVRVDSGTINNNATFLGGYEGLLRTVIPRSRLMLDVISLLASLSMHKIVNYTVDKDLARVDDRNHLLLNPIRIIKLEENNLIELLNNSHRRATTLTDVVGPHLTTKGNDLLRKTNFGLDSIREEIKGLKDKTPESMLTYMTNAVNSRHDFMTTRAPCTIKPEVMVGEHNGNGYIFSSPILVTQNNVAANLHYTQETRYPFAIGMISMCYDDLDTESCPSFLKDFSGSWVDPKAEQYLSNKHIDGFYDRYREIVEKGSIGTTKTDLVSSRTLFETTYARGLFYRLNKSLMSLVLSGIDADQSFVLKPFIHEISNLISAVSNKKYTNTVEVIGGYHIPENFKLPTYVFDRNLEILLQASLEISSSNKKSSGMTIVETFVALPIENRKIIQNQLTFAYEQIMLIRHMAMVIADLNSTAVYQGSYPDEFIYMPTIPAKKYDTPGQRNDDDTVNNTAYGEAFRLNAVNDLIGLKGNNLGMFNTRILKNDLSEWVDNYMANMMNSCDALLVGIKKISATYLSNINPIFENVLQDTRKLTRAQKDLPFTFITLAVPIRTSNLNAYFDQRTLSKTTNGFGQLLTPLLQIDSMAKLNKSFKWIDEFFNRAGVKTTTAIDVLRMAMSPMYTATITARSDRSISCLYENIIPPNGFTHTNVIGAGGHMQISYFQSLDTTSLSKEIIHADREISTVIDKYYELMADVRSYRLDDSQMIHLLLKYNLVIFNQSAMATITESPILDVFTALGINIFKYIETKFSFGNRSSGDFVKDVLEELVSLNDIFGGNFEAPDATPPVQNLLNRNDKHSILIGGKTLAGINLFDRNYQLLIRILSNKSFNFTQQQGGYKMDGVNPPLGTLVYRSYPKDGRSFDLQIPSEKYRFTRRMTTYLLSTMPFIPTSLYSMLNSIVPQLVIRLIVMAVEDKYPKHESEKILEEVGVWMDRSRFIQTMGPTLVQI